LEDFGHNVNGAKALYTKMFCAQGLYMLFDSVLICLLQFHLIYR